MKSLEAAYVRLELASNRALRAVRAVRERLQAPPSVLVIEDESELLKEYEQTLYGRARVFHAKTIGQALRILREERIDLIISDSIGIPVLSIVADWETRPRSVVVSSGTPYEPDRAARIGIEEWFVKPLRPEELITLVEKYTAFF